METPVIEALRNFIKKYPKIAELNKGLNVEYQGEDPGSYSLEYEPGEVWIKRYVNGTGQKQFNFVLSGREVHTEDVHDNIDNSAFYEEFAEWLDQCTARKEFPVLGTNQKAYEISATTGGYLNDSENGTAQYIIQCSLKYYQL